MFLVGGPDDADNVDGKLGLGPSLSVDSRSNGLQVIRIDAMSNPTQVVELEASGDHAVLRLVVEAMRPLCRSAGSAL